MKAHRQSQDIIGSQWQCSAYWQLLQSLALQHSAQTQPCHTAYVSFRYWIILLLSNIAVPVLGSSMYGTCTRCSCQGGSSAGCCSAANYT